MEKLLPLSYYHIYNHANGNENIFREEKNYRFFMGKYNKYIVPIADTLAYCLMPNHFHLLVKIKEDISGITSPQEASAIAKSSHVFKTSDDSGKSSDYCYTNHFKNLFQSYTKSVNKVYSRKGSLFNQRFKRKRIDSEDFLRAVLIYIHLNPVLHGFCGSPEQWKYSSYNAYFENSGNTKVATMEGISYFGDEENLLHCHNEKLIGNYEEKLKRME